MRLYSVITSVGAVDIEAERMERVFVHDSPKLIRFIVGRDIVAEFYFDRISGWMERREE